MKVSSSRDLGQRLFRETMSWGGRWGGLRWWRPGPQLNKCISAQWINLNSDATAWKAFWPSQIWWEFALPTFSCDIWVFLFGEHATFLIYCSSESRSKATLDKLLPLIWLLVSSSITWRENNTYLPPRTVARIKAVLGKNAWHVVNSA